MSSSPTWRDTQRLVLIAATSLSSSSHNSPVTRYTFHYAGLWPCLFRWNKVSPLPFLQKLSCLNCIEILKNIAETWIAVTDARKNYRHDNERNSGRYDTIVIRLLPLRIRRSGHEPEHGQFHTLYVPLASGSLLQNSLPGAHWPASCSQLAVCYYQLSELPSRGGEWAATKQW